MKNMKRILALAAVIALAVLAGTFTTQKAWKAPAENKSAEQPAEQSLPAVSSDGTPLESGPAGGSGSAEGAGAVQVEEGLFNVTLTIPAEYMENVTQADLDDQTGQGKYKSATLQPDGSVVIVMSKAQHEQVVSATAASIDEGLNAMIGSADYPNFVSIVHNGDYTDFTVTTKSTELDFTEAVSTLAFYLDGGLYNAFAGNSVDNIHVSFVNEATGSLIQESNSRDMEG